MGSQCARYTVVVEPGLRNWSAYVPDLPICVSTGRTRAAVKRRIREAIVFHMEGLQEERLPIPRPGVSTRVVDVEVPGADGGAGAHTRQYVAVVEPDRDRWVAYIPDIWGCSTAGETCEEAERNIRTALASHIALLREQGAPIPVPGRRIGVVEVEVPDEAPAAEAPSQVEAP
jgi:predicted RNase H-like HicB family nuclease